jgi:phenylacetic acid degradation operon negative regulatory protein
VTASDLVDDSPGQPAPPRSLIVTVYGLYAREVGGWISVSTLIRLLAELDVDAPAVRSSISRLKRREILVAERRDGRAGYALSPYARSVLETGDRRIFERHAVTDDGWVIAVFSVPESERQHRHQLRSRLAWLGFGTVSSGVWIAPAHALDDTRDHLLRHGLDQYVDLFRADYVSFGDPAEQVGRWWDLDALQKLYDDFVAEFTPMAGRWAGTDRNRACPAPSSPPRGPARRRRTSSPHFGTPWRTRRTSSPEACWTTPREPAGSLPERLAELGDVLRRGLDRGAHRDEAVLGAHDVVPAFRIRQRLRDPGGAGEYDRLRVAALEPPVHTESGRRTPDGSDRSFEEGRVLAECVDAGHHALAGAALRGEPQRSGGGRGLGRGRMTVPVTAVGHDPSGDAASQHEKTGGRHESEEMAAPPSRGNAAQCRVRGLQPGQQLVVIH